MGASQQALIFGGAAPSPPVTYDWETGPTSLAFTPNSGDYSYFTAPGAGRGGTTGGVVLMDGFVSSALFTSATLPHQYTNYDMWIQYDTISGLTVSAHLGPTNVGLMYSDAIGGTSGWVHFSGTMSGPFDNIVLSFGANVVGGSADVVMDDWTFS